MNDWERDHEARWESHFDDASHDDQPEQGHHVRMGKVSETFEEVSAEIDENLKTIEKAVDDGWTLQWVPPENPLGQACERIRQLLLVIDHADQHDGKLLDHEGEVENARRFLKSLE